MGKKTGSITNKDMCNATGIHPRTMQMYTEFGMFDNVFTPVKTGTAREYTQHNIKQAMVMVKLKETGMSLTDIKTIINNPIKSIEDVEPYVDQYVAMYRMMKGDIDYV